MQIHLTGRNLELTQPLKDFANEKVKKLDQRGDGISNVYVTFQVEKLSHKAEATLHLLGKDLHAEATAENMYSAIDKLVDRMLQQITHHKEKVEDGRIGK